MSDYPQNPNTQNEPLIPPQVLLYVAIFGFLIAIVVLFTQPEFSVIGYGGLAIGLLSLLAWGLLAPEQLRAAFTGRTARFGGTSIFVTAVFIVALAAIYILVRQQKWHNDITDTSTFSLSAETTELLKTIAADPTTPQIKIIGFYGTAQGAEIDRNTILFDQYVRASNNKISYEIVDPDRNPQITDLYELGNNDIVVVPLRDDGSPDVERKELVSFFNQEDITNAILRVSAQGDFRAYFLTVEQGLQLDNANGGLTQLKEAMDQFKWTSQSITLTDLLNPEGEIKLNDPAADGEVLVIPGGATALPDEAAKAITDYLDAGGDVILFADINTQGEPSLATAPNLSDYLAAQFGVRVNDDLILDRFNQLQNPLTILASDFGNHPVTTPQNFNAVIFGYSRSITIAPTLPPNVTVTPLIRTSANAYAKVGLNLSTADESAFAQQPNDPTGPFVVAVAAENTQTGARLVIFGSRDVPVDQYAAFAAVGFGNLDTTFRSLAWATGYDEFFVNIPRVSPTQNPADTPIIADDQQIRLINFVTVGVLPFGLLLLGFFIRQLGRERQIASQ